MAKKTTKKAAPKKAAPKAKKAKKEDQGYDKNYRGSDVTFCTTMSRLNPSYGTGWNSRESW